MDPKVLRDELAALLRGDQAHADPQHALLNVKPEIRARRPEGLRSIWEELEHMRLAQEDIVEYTLHASWKSPAFPDGYWPAPIDEVSDSAWVESTSAFLSDLDRAIDIATDESRTLTDQIPHGEGRTYLREVLLVADHNAYHVGQIVTIRKLLGDWPPQG